MKRMTFLAGLYSSRNKMMREIDDLCHANISHELRDALDAAIENIAEELQLLEKEIIEEATNEKSNQKGSPRLP